MLKENFIQQFEQVTLNAWPALNEYYMDGWLLRFSNGFTKRANSVNILYDSNDDLEYKLKKCEGIYEKMNLRPIFKLTDSTHYIKEFLESHDYTPIGKSDVQLLHISHDDISFEEKSDSELVCFEEFNEEWFEIFCNMKNLNLEQRSTAKKMFEKMLNESLYIILKRNENIIGIAMAVFESEFVGVFDLIINEDFRRLGHGEYIMNFILNYSSERGYRKSYLQVLSDNESAFKLYEKLGYKTVYNYYYMVKND
ncbi:GNAT family N-acetyltransferase [Oceanotoga sp. DSM 15011]|uniref:GNAT family N-acetyltransferase n=1 Tax=Oceanotoga sp. DSM 15011 TaxID=2984951 RepID=UPI0021F43C65|nr:GNAT family N-acetyltransferase [Oceanotoga sp. DSM 15011]UYP01318.1 GNAT family N-acetyltransferase [Oceanotoga sp. DSM 15011]